MTPYYEDDSVTLYHGNCLVIDVPWRDADVLVTDPPYGMRYADRGGVSVEGDGDTQARDAVIGLWGPSRPALVFGTWKVTRPPLVRQVLVWDKSGGSGFGSTRYPWGNTHEEVYVMGQWPRIEAGGRAREGGVPVIGHSVLGFPVQNPASADRPNHPTPKPVSLMAALISKCPPGVIADPFAGSGSTLLAAKHLGRKAIGIEVDERYCEVAANRLSQDLLDFGGAA